MANRFWVLGTGTWDAATTTNWSATSGGSGGASVPTTTDDVFLDGNSGTGTITVAANAFIHSFTTTGYAGSITTTGGTQTLVIYNNLVLNSGTNFSGAGALRLQMQGASNSTITSAGSNFPGSVLINATVGNSIGLADNFIGSFPLYHYQGIFNTNDYSLSCAIYTSNLTGSTRVVNFGASTINFSSGPVDFRVGTGTLSLNAGTSNIYFGGTGSHIFYPNSLAYYNIYYNKTSGYSTTISGSASYNILSVAGNSNAIFGNGTTHTVNSFTTTGSAGNRANFYSDLAGTPFTLSDSSGTNTVSYSSLSDCTASGGATWIADASCLNYGNNAGWTFQGPQSNMFESVNISENITVKMPSNLSVSVFDSINVSENKTAAQVLAISVFDSINVSENRTINQPINISVYDSVNVSENINVATVYTFLTVQALVVGGGGAGADGGANVGGGGGGAGGYKYDPAFVVATQTYSVTVGAGGINDVTPDGGASSFSTLSVLGGGGANAYSNGDNGGSGSGAPGSNRTQGTGTAGQGNDGGNGQGTVGFTNCSAGGGGGSGGVGAYGGAPGVGVAAGGIGTSNSITGSAVTYAAGGDGGNTSSSTNLDGAANTGNGGSGAPGQPYGGTNGKNGGSGVVIISWLTSAFGTCSVTGTGNTISTNGANSVAKFIVSGNLTLTDGSKSINVYDSINVSENLSKVDYLAISVFDSINVSENRTITNASLGAVSVFDSINISENFSNLDILYVNVFDSLNISEFKTVLSSSVSQSDQLNISENVNVTIPFLGNVSVFDQLNISENLSKVDFLYLNVFDQINLSENLSDSGILYISTFSLINISESIPPVTNPNLGGINTYNLINVSENIVSFSSLGNISVLDSINISENVTPSNSLLGKVNIFDSINLSENVSSLSTLGDISKYDLINISEIVKTEWYNSISIYDQLNISENFSSKDQLGDIRVNDLVNLSEKIYTESFNNFQVIDNIRTTENIVTESFRFSPSPGGSQPSGALFSRRPIASSETIVLEGKTDSSAAEQPRGSSSWGGSPVASKGISM